MEGSLLQVGQVVKTQGIKGEVRISSPQGGGDALTPGNVVYLEVKGERRALTIASSRPRGHLFILAFREVKGISEAEELVGSSVFVDPKTLPSLPADEFYWYQLIGLRVETERGVPLGTLEEIFTTGSNDVFVVRREGHEILIPATDEVIIHVDLQARRMIIRPVEGLLAEDDL